MDWTVPMKAPNYPIRQSIVQSKKLCLREISMYGKGQFLEVELVFEEN